MKKRILPLALAGTMSAVSLAGRGSKTTTTPTEGTTAAKAKQPVATDAVQPETEASKVDDANLSEVEKTIKEVEGTSIEELAEKAVEESNGKTSYGVGNSSRGKSALPLFIKYLQTISPSYTMEYEWQQPKNNKIFEQLSADSLKSFGTFVMTLIQDGNQIESKMVQTGTLKTSVPKEWAEANGTIADVYTGFLPLQTLNKVFMYNSIGSVKYENRWDFVAEGVHPLYMDIDPETIGKNFLYVLTEDKYAATLKEAYDALDSTKQAYFKPVIDGMVTDAQDLGLGADGAYALAWIKLWVENYNKQADDGPIRNTLVTDSATDQYELLAYSKLHSVEEPAGVPLNNIKVAAYEDGYEGIGSYGYYHYLFLTNNNPFLRTSCAFIAYMTNTADSSSAWGKDIGGYSSNPKVMEETEKTCDHSRGSYNDADENVFDCKNDGGYDQWVGGGELALEDPQYCADVSFTIGSWTELLTKYSDVAS